MTIDLLIAISGIIVSATIAIILHKLNEKKQDELITKNLPKAKIFFFNYELKENTTYDIIYCVNLDKFDKNNVILYYEFPISIGNIGKITIENVTVRLIFGPKSPLPIEDKWLKLKGAISKDFLIRVHSKLKRRTIITNTIKYINPNIRYDIGELFKLNKTNIEWMHTLPNSQKISIKAKVSHKIEMVFEAKNLVPKTYIFNLSLIDYKKNSDCINHINSEYKDLNPWEKYEYSMKKEIFFFFPKINKIDEKNGIRMYAGNMFSDGVKYFDIKPEIAKKTE